MKELGADIMRINHSCITDGLLAVVDLYGDDAAYLVDERTLAPVKIDIDNDTVIVNSSDFRDGTLLATDIIRTTTSNGDSSSANPDSDSEPVSSITCSTIRISWPWNSSDIQLRKYHIVMHRKRDGKNRLPAPLCV